MAACPGLTLPRRFSTMVMPTLGVDFSAKNLPSTDNSTIRLHLWDVAGDFVILYEIFGPFHFILL